MKYPDIVTKESVEKLSELCKKDKVTPMDVLRFWREYGYLFPTIEVVQELKDEFGII